MCHKTKPNQTVVVYYTAYSKNTTDILNCNLYGASKFRQVVMVAPFS